MQDLSFNPSERRPQLGDSQTWTALLEQGREVLLDHTIVGYKRMPPMGGCIQCSEDEFAQLIEYMAGQPLHQE